jgi:transcriptional regulator with XRE-family HTH domain
MDINARIARRVRELRDAQGFSLDALAERSGVSRSNISLIERGQSSPTATVLDKLAAGLGVTLASLFEDSKAPVAEPSPVARVAEQPVWTDPASGYVRRNLSPAARSPIQLVDVIFPAGQRVAYDSAAREVEIHQQVWMIDGVMEVTVGDEHWRLEAGDCLVMRLDRPIVYRNPARRPARYLVALATLPFMPTRRA